MIGADVGGKLLTGKRVQLSSGLVAVETLLGWTLMGKVPGPTIRSNLSMIVTLMLVQGADISDLWNLETIGIREPSEQRSKEHALLIKNIFLETVSVNNEGRYEVYLPWVDGHPPLPTNKNMAEKRLVSLTKRLEVGNMMQQYNEVFQEWLADGVIEAVQGTEENNCGHYFPHRPVVKEGNATTRIRPVFDASANKKGNPSLNLCLESEPNLIELIPSVILRFREGKWGIIADIRKAFLQISVASQDRDYLRFLWYSDLDTSRLLLE